MDVHNCKNCNKIFKNKYSLIKHEKNIENCIDINQQTNEAIICKHCNKNYVNEYSLSRHIKICKKFLTLQEEQKRNEDKIKLDELKSENKLIEDKNRLLEDKYRALEEKYKLLENQNISLEKNLNEYKEREKEQNKKITILEQNLNDLAKTAIENAGTKNTINNRNQIYQALQPLTEEYMKEQVQHLTYTDVKNGAAGIANFAYNFTFKDRVFCSDVSRLNFVFKNENNAIIKDPEGVEITKKFIDINREELLRLLEQYYKYVLEYLDKDLDCIEYKHWAGRREEIITIRSAIKRGLIPENKESFDEFKKKFLSALSQIVPR